MRYFFGRPKIKYGKAFNYLLKEWQVYDNKTKTFIIVDGFSVNEARQKIYNARKRKHD